MAQGFLASESVNRDDNTAQLIAVVTLCKTPHAIASSVAVSHACRAIAISAVLIAVSEISSARNSIESVMPNFSAILLFRSREFSRTSTPITLASIAQLYADIDALQMLGKHGRIQDRRLRAFLFSLASAGSRILKNSSTWRYLSCIEGLITPL